MLHSWWEPALLSFVLLDYDAGEVDGHSDQSQGQRVPQSLRRGRVTGRLARDTQTQAAARYVFVNMPKTDFQTFISPGSYLESSWELWEGPNGSQVDQREWNSLLKKESRLPFQGLWPVMRRKWPYQHTTLRTSEAFQFRPDGSLLLINQLGSPTQLSSRIEFRHYYILRYS